MVIETLSRNIFELIRLLLGLKKTQKYFKIEKLQEHYIFQSLMMRLQPLLKNIPVDLYIKH